MQSLGNAVQHVPAWGDVLIQDCITGLSLCQVTLEGYEKEVGLPAFTQEKLFSNAKVLKIARSGGFLYTWFMETVTIRSTTEHEAQDMFQLPLQFQLPLPGGWGCLSTARDQHVTVLTQ